MTEHLGVNLPDDIAIAMKEHLHVTGLTKTQLVLAALKHQLGMESHEPLADRVGKLETRVEEISNALKLD